jgi:hypothetical protein
MSRKKLACIIFLLYLQVKDMKIWSFKVFVKPNGRDTFEEWITSIDLDAEERIRAMIRRLSVMKTWGRPYFSGLKGHKNICEIRVKAKDKQYRPLGCFGPGPQVFTLLIGASKKGKVWSPSKAIKTAEKRLKLVFEDRRYIGEYKQ